MSIFRNGQGKRNSRGNLRTNEEEGRIAEKVTQMVRQVLQGRKKCLMLKTKKKTGEIRTKKPPLKEWGQG